MKILFSFLILAISTPSFAFVDLRYLAPDNPITYATTPDIESIETFRTYFSGNNTYDAGTSVAIDFSETDFSIYDVFTVSIRAIESHNTHSDFYYYDFTYHSDVLSSDPIALFEVPVDTSFRRASYYIDVEALVNPEETLSYNFSVYTVSPVPEASTVAMLFSGVGVISLMTRRKKKRSR